MSSVGIVVLPGLLFILPLRWIPPLTSSFMLQSEVAPVRFNWVGWEQLPTHLRLAIVASEDQRFPSHNGFDIKAIESAWNERKSGRLRGASTISQQVAKNLYLWPGGWLRKAIEAWITTQIEYLLPKRRILEIYLNIAEFAPGVYGAEAAARHHFGISANQLNRHQAALLAAVLPNPKQLSASNPSQYVANRSWVIRQQMEQLGPGWLAEL